MHSVIHSITVDENLLKFSGNNGKKNAANCLQEYLVKSPSVCKSPVMSVVAPVSALSIPSIHLSDDEHQEIPEEIPCTSHGEKFPVEKTAKSLTMQPEPYIK